MTGSYDVVLSVRKDRLAKLRAKLCSLKSLQPNNRHKLSASDVRTRNQRLLKDTLVFSRELQVLSQTYAILAKFNERKLTLLHGRGPDWELARSHLLAKNAQLRATIAPHAHVEAPATLACIEHRVELLADFNRSLADLLGRSDEDRLQLDCFLSDFFWDRSSGLAQDVTGECNDTAMQECLAYEGAALLVQAAWRGFHWRKTVLHNPNTPAGQRWLAAQANKACAAGL